MNNNADGTTVAVALVAIWSSVAMAQAPFVSIAMSSDPFLGGRSAFIGVGHEPMAPDPTVRRYTGKVVDLGSPDGKGKVYSFKPAPVGPRNFPLSADDLRGWRMTMLSGKRFGEVFRVKGNTDSEVNVTADSGPIDGVAINDVFVIESIDANGASMFAPATGNSTAPGTGV